MEIPTMADIVNDPKTPAGWLEILEESEAEVAAGLIVPGEIVHQRLRESIARLTAKALAKQPKATS
jgi:hypothetical protein